MFKERKIKATLPPARHYEARQVGENQLMTFPQGAPEGRHVGGRFFDKQYDAEYATELMDIAFAAGAQAMREAMFAAAKKIDDFALKAKSY